MNYLIHWISVILLVASHSASGDISAASISSQRLVGWEDHQKLFALLVTAGQENQPAVAGSAAPARRIEVILSSQRLIAWEGDAKVFEFLVTTGQEGQPTVPGEYEILDKEEEPYSYLWGLRMPFWLGVYYVGEYENGFHALPITRDGAEVWGEALGKYPASHGCIVLSRADAETLYHWVSVGAKVTIHD